jgi:hypothetical protein
MAVPPSPAPPEPHLKKRRVVRRANGLVQLIGAAVFFHEVVIWGASHPIRTQVLFLCGIALLGAESAKDVAIRVWDDTLGRTLGSEPRERDE